MIGGYHAFTFSNCHAFNSTGKLFTLSDCSLLTAFTA